MLTHPRTLLRTFLLAVLSLVLALPFPGAAQAATINVPGGDTAALYSAIAAAAPGDTLSLGAGTFTLGAGELVLDKNLTLTGSGTVIIDANGASRVMFVASGVTVTVANMTLRNGNDPNGGGGIRNQGTLNLGTVRVTANSAQFSGVAQGGGVLNEGTLTANNSTIDGNTGDLGGGIRNIGSLRLTNVTLFGNTGTTGGAIRSSGTLDVRSSTIVNNTGGGAGGIQKDGGTTFTLYNSILANNGVDCASTNPITFSAGASNLIESATTCGTAGTNYISADPNLGASFGFPPYFLLNTGSPALGIGDLATCTTISVNGIIRADDGDCDLGAYESVNTPPVIVPGQAFNILQNVLNGTLVGTVQASDADNDPLTFSIVGGNTGNVFSIDNGGVLRVIAPLVVGTYTLSVQVNDGAGGLDTETVLVNVTAPGGGNTPPTITAAQVFTIVENVGIGTVVGTVAVNDPDNDPLAFSITFGNTGGAFAINNAGALTVAGPLNAAATPTYSLRVQVEDGRGGVDSEIITVTVLPAGLGNNPPTITAGQAFTIVENVALGTQLGTVAAADPDGDPLTFSIIFGNTGGVFAINNTGALTVAGALDAATTPTYGLQVQVEDGRGGVDAEIVTVNVLAATLPTGGGAESTPLPPDPLLNGVTRPGVHVRALYNIVTSTGWAPGKDYPNIGLGSGPVWEGYQAGRLLYADDIYTPVGANLNTAAGETYCMPGVGSVYFVRNRQGTEAKSAEALFRLPASGANQTCVVLPDNGIVIIIAF